jgi:uncharacterized protein
MSFLQRLASPLRYEPSNPAGLGVGLAIVLALAFAYMLAQFLIGLALAIAIYGDITDPRILTKSMIMATLPAAILAGVLAWTFAKVRNGEPRKVLALGNPRLSALQWLGIILGFVAGMWVVATLVTVLSGIDPAQYTPGPDGTSPSTGSAGLVKEAMYSLAHEPARFLIAVLGVTFGAPLAEEIIFRGQAFAVLAQSRIGKWGAVFVTSVCWALLHATEPWFSVGLIFLMGLVLGWLLLRFGSLWVTMACHGAWNAVYSLLIFEWLTK